jgi:hypothetical protein
MTADETKNAIEGIRRQLLKEALTPEKKKAAELMVVGLDLLQSFLLDVKAIADEHRRETKVAVDYEAHRKIMEQ